MAQQQMAPATIQNTAHNWEKPKRDAAVKRGQQAQRWQFLTGGVLILLAVGYLMLSGTLSGARFFLTVDDVASNPLYTDETVRMSGAVLGDTIRYDASTGNLSFTVVNIPAEFDDLAAALNEAVNDPDARQLTVMMNDETMPDLLQHEAQAIMTGHLGADGVFPRH